MRVLTAAATTLLLLGCPDDPPVQPAPEDVASDTAEPEPDDTPPTDTGPADVVTPPDVPDIPTPPPDLPDTPDPGPPDEGPGEEVVDPVTVSLVNMFAFMVPQPDADPWYGDGEYADEYQCEPFTHMAETTETGDWYDVETSFCGYLTVAQPLLVAVPKGAVVQVDIVHEIITDADDGFFTLAVAMGDPAEFVWEKKIPAPAVEAEIQETWIAARDYEAGEPVYWHLSNHGDNVWSLTDLTATF